MIRSVSFSVVWPLTLGLLLALNPPFKQLQKPLTHLAYFPSGGKSTSNIWNVCLGFLVLIFHVGVLVCAEMFPVYSSRPSGAVNLHLSLRDVSAVRRDWVSRWWSVNDKCNCPATSFSPLDAITHLLAVWTVIAIGRGLESTVYSPKHKIIVEFVTSYLDHNVKLKCWGKVNCRIVYVLKNQIAC